MTMQQSDGKSVRLHLNTITTCKFVFVLKKFKNSGNFVNFVMELRSPKRTMKSGRVERPARRAEAWRHMYGPTTRHCLT